MDVLDFRVLHTLRCVGFSGEDRVARAAGVTPVDAVAALGRLYERTLVESSGGPFGGWGITDAGRARDQQLVTEELAESGVGPQVRDCYLSFLELNPELMRVSSDWQMRSLAGSPIVNDHTDPDYDTRVLDRLIRLDEAVQPICVDLASLLPRFAPYASRLATALERAMAGETAYVADNLDSYHIVWAQLHEDLLQTLAISREDERGSLG